MNPAYQETTQYLFSRLPMYQRVGSSAFKKDLKNIKALLKALDNPHKKFKSIHIAGTNGKGSCSHMCASVLMAAGFKTALYTSPHLKDYRERIKIDGELIPEDYVVSFVQGIKKEIELIEPSFFEITVAMAFQYFAESKIDIAVIETGLGGRLDSTNVITPECCLITNIGLEHTSMLGNTLSEIAREKAGIIKPNVPVIIGRTQEETKIVFDQTANEKRSLIKYADNVYKSRARYGKMGIDTLSISRNTKPFINELKPDLKGPYQEENICSTIALVEQLRNAGYHISEKALIEGLERTSENTALNGRWDILQENPSILADTAHNKDGIEQLINYFTEHASNKMHIIFSVVKEKDLKAIQSILPKEAVYYLTEPSIDRAMPLKELQEQFDTFNVAFCGMPSDALQIAKENASKEDLILITGSTFLVAEII